MKAEIIRLLDVSSEDAIECLSRARNFVSRAEQWLNNQE